jgi:hypothetical protein
MPVAHIPDFLCDFWEPAGLPFKRLAGPQITRVAYVRTSVARISYYAALTTTTHAGFLEESRTKSLNATNLDRKSAIRGPKTMGEAHQSFSFPSKRLAGSKLRVE